MRLSIIIPVYNVGTYLETTLENVLSQNLKDFELILIDDGSTDGSAAICDKYASLDNRVVVGHQKNAGVSDARNKGVALARGEYIGFVDSDDLIEPNMFEVMLEVAERNNADIVQCRHNRSESVCGVEYSGNERSLDGKTFVKEIFTYSGSEYTNQVALWSKIYKRELFKHVHFPEGRTYEDEQETYKLCLFAERIIEIPDELYHYVRRENSIITGVSAKKMLDKQAALTDRLMYLPQYIPELSEKCAKSFCLFSENILCEMYKNDEKKAVDTAVSVLLSLKDKFCKDLNKYQRIYYPLLKFKPLRNIILAKQFAPIQKFIGKLKKSDAKKVIILNHGLHISGVSKTLVNFANALVAHGYDVTLKIEINDFTLQSELDPRVKCSQFLKEPYIFGVRVRGFLRFYRMIMPKLLKCSPRLQYKIFVRKKYDIEIAFNRGACAKIISGSCNKKARKLVWVHSDYMRNDNPLAGFNSLEDAQKGYSKFDKIVCVSEQAQKAFAEKFGEGYPLVTRYNIMDINRIKKMVEEKPAKKSDVFTVVAVGRLCEAKNYPLLMEAVDILNKRGHSLKCIIIGGGNIEKSLLDYRESLGLENVVFMGAMTNPYPYIKDADLYVSSSIYEGLSTTAIESLILEKPCVVTDCTGMKNIFGENNDYGVVVPIDKTSLANAIEKMMTDDEFRCHYQLKAKERAEFFDPEKAFKDIEELF